MKMSDCCNNNDKLYSVLVYRLQQQQQADMRDTLPVCLAQYTHHQHPCDPPSLQAATDDASNHQDNNCLESAVCQMIHQNLVASASARGGGDASRPNNWEPGTLGGFQKVIRSCWLKENNSVATTSDAAADERPCQVLYGRAPETLQHCEGEEDGNNNTTMLCFGVVTGPAYPDRLAIQLLHEIYKQWKYSMATTSCRSIMQGYASECLINSGGNTVSLLRSTSSSSTRTTATTKTATSTVRERHDSVDFDTSTCDDDSHQHNGLINTDQDSMVPILRDACVKYDELHQIARRMQTLQLAKDHKKEEQEQQLDDDPSSPCSSNDNNNNNNHSSSFWCNTGIERMDYDGNETTSTTSTSTSSSSSSSSSSGRLSPAQKRRQALQKKLSLKNVAQKLGMNKKKHKDNRKQQQRQKQKVTANVQCKNNVQQSPTTRVAFQPARQEVSA